MHKLVLKNSVEYLVFITVRRVVKDFTHEKDKLLGVERCVF